MEEKSGVDSLIDALRASGADVDNKFGGKENSAKGQANGSQGAKSGTKTGAQAGNAQAKSAATDNGKKSSGGRGGRGGVSDISKAIISGQVGEKVKAWSKRKKIIMSIVLLLVLAAAYWWFHPPINIQSETTWLIVLVLICLPLFVFFRSRLNKYQPEESKNNKQSKIAWKIKSTINMNASETKKDSEKDKKAEDLKDKVSGVKNAEKAKKFKYLSFIPVAVLLLGIIGLLVSASFFPGNAEKYANVLQTQNLDFKQDIQEVDYSQIPIIDRDTARVLGTKEMGTIPDYVSQFEINDLYSQINFQGKPVRVSPLDYADLFKWLTNREQGIPAYCIIDMTTQNAKIARVSDVDGTQGQGIKYSESEPLARNIHRYIQLKYPFYMFDEFSFEVDEKGHPWWICPVQERSIGLFGGKTIRRVVMCDAVSGECTDLDVNDLLNEEWQWVDRVYPSDLLLEQYNWSGKYKKGWLNSWLGQSGVVKTTPGQTSSSSSGSNSSGKSLGYNYIAKDDDVWVYTGVTSATSDTSIVGFILINQRTAESHFYSISGATETAAMESAEGQVQHLRYVSTFPILINVANQPTYFMALKDSAGLVKKFAMIDIQRYQNVAIGDTVAECQKSYQTLLAREGIEMGSSKVTAGQEGAGTIANITSAVIDGNSHFYVTLSGDSKIYDFALPNLIRIVAYKVGDPIHFHFAESEDKQICSVSSID